MRVEHLYTAVDGDAVPLLYGRTYELRVRLGDVSGGGPDSDAEPVHPAPAAGGGAVPSARARARSHLEGVADPVDPPAELTIHRPMLAYPAAMLAGIPNAAQRLLDPRTPPIRWSCRCSMSISTTSRDWPRRRPVPCAFRPRATSC